MSCTNLMDRLLGTEYKLRRLPLLLPVIAW